jgi:hypothetical protein
VEKEIGKLTSTYGEFMISQDFFIIHKFRSGLTRALMDQSEKGMYDKNCTRFGHPHDGGNEI